MKYYPDNSEVFKPVQVAAVIADLVKHTTATLKQLGICDQQSLQSFQSLQMRTAKDTEMIVTQFITQTTQTAYILVAIQNCK